MIKRKPLWVLLFAVLFQYPVISRFLRDVAWTGLIINIQEELPVFHGVYLFRNICIFPFHIVVLIVVVVTISFAYLPSDAFF